MWLDRLASQAGSPTPSSQPGSRSYSPLPGRPSGGLNPYVTSQRANQTPRGSAVSLVSGSSTTSLLGAAKKPNGSGLRRSTSYSEGPAPEKLLEKLLGTKITDSGTDDERPHSITEADLELDFDLAGLTLEELASTHPTDTKPAGTRRSQTDRECKPLTARIVHPSPSFH